MMLSSPSKWSFCEIRDISYHYQNLLQETLCLQCFKDFFAYGQIQWCRIQIEKNSWAKTRLNERFDEVDEGFSCPSKRKISINLLNARNSAIIRWLLNGEPWWDIPDNRAHMKWGIIWIGASNLSDTIPVLLFSNVNVGF